MKTTKRTALNKRILKLKLASNSIIGNMIADLKKGDRLRPVYSQGSTWKYSSLIDKSGELKSTLNFLGINYTIGNDSPRGGKTGYYIEILTKIID
jgi:hypothetical protein